MMGLVNAISRCGSRASEEDERKKILMAKINILPLGTLNSVGPTIK
jgi:hypothetical protein